MKANSIQGAVSVYSSAVNLLFLFSLPDKFLFEKMAVVFNVPDHEMWSNARYKYIVKHFHIFVTLFIKYYQYKDIMILK